MKLGSSSVVFLMLGLLLFFAYWVTPVPAQAASDTQYVQEISYALEQPFGGETIIQSWGQYIQLVYQFAVTLVSIIAVVLIMLGGVRWIVAAGNESAITEAKEMITSAIMGLVIALLSYTLLVFINPQLVEQSFSVAKIPVPNSDAEFWKREWCNASTPAIASESCNSSISGTQQCSEVVCGDTAVYEWGGVSATCRGGKCDSGNGSPNCYPKPDNPYSAASCQMQDCGEWARTCYNNNSDPSKVDSYNECLCKYYQTKVMPLMGAGTDPNSYTQAQFQQFYLFCTEAYSQEDFVSAIRLNSGSVYTPTSTTGLENVGLNCNFGCNISNTVDTSVYTAYKSALAEFFTGSSHTSLQYKCDK